MSQSPTRMLDRWMSAGMLAPAMLLVGVLVLIPSVLAVIGSFYEFGITSQNWVFVGLGNYARAFADPIFWTALKNNIFLIIGSIITQVGLGTLFAALLDRGVRRGNTFYRTVIFMPVIISSIAVAFVWILIFDPNVGPLNAMIKGLGLTPPRLGWLGDPNISLYMLLVIAAWQNVGFQMVLVLAGLQAIPKELYEAAALDGAKGWRAFVHITLPGIRNVLMVGTLICIIGGLKVFDLVFVTTGGGPANATQVIGSYTYLQAFTLGNMGYADALSVILLVVALGFGWLQLTLSRRG